VWTLTASFHPSGDLYYDNIITGYESPRFIGFINNGLLQQRMELALERKDSKMYPCMLNIKIYTRRRSYFMQVSHTPVWLPVPGDFGMGGIPL
jgi:hypothetical protein